MMRTLPARSAVVLLLTWLLATPAAAVAINLATVVLNTSAFANDFDIGVGGVTDGDSGLFPVPVGPVFFDDALASASQGAASGSATSSITTQVSASIVTWDLDASFSALVGHQGLADIQAVVLPVLEFVLTEPTTISITGTLGSSGGSSANVSLIESGVPGLLFEQCYGTVGLGGCIPGSPSVNFSTVLPAGTYQVSSGAGAATAPSVECTGSCISASGSGAATSDLVVTFSVVPEPTTAALLGLGLAGLAMRRGRARAA